MNQTTSVTLTCDRRTIDVLNQAAEALRSGARTGDPSEREVLLTAIEESHGVREKHGKGAAGLKEMAALLDTLPTYLREDRTREMVDLDVQSIARVLIDELDELAHLTGKRILFVWKRKHGTRTGQVVLGTCKAASRRERETWGEEGAVPWWTITLALDAWLLATPEERMRLVHHEMMHADVAVDDEGRESPTVRGHDIEEFEATSSRFGPASRAQVLVAMQALRHPAVAERQREWAVDEQGQGLLFGAWTP